MIDVDQEERDGGARISDDALGKLRGELRPGEDHGEAVARIVDRYVELTGGERWAVGIDGLDVDVGTIDEPTSHDDALKMWEGAGEPRLEAVAGGDTSGLGGAGWDERDGEAVKVAGTYAAAVELLGEAEALGADARGIGTA